MRHRRGLALGAMKSSWIKSPAGRRVVEHWADPRPTWLWSADGQMLVWRNRAALLFHGNSRKGAWTEEVIPLKGQIGRLIRLGSPNRASLSRMQFLADDRPVSATCSCTPLMLAGDQPALLVVTVDPVDAKALARLPEHDQLVESLLPPGTAYLLLDEHARVAAGSAEAVAELAPLVASHGLPAFDSDGNGVIETDTGPRQILCLKASPRHARLLLTESATLEQAPRAADEAAAHPMPAEPPAPVAEPMLPLGLPPLPPPEAEPETAEAPAPAAGALASLFDRLMDDRALYTPLGPDEDFLPPPVTPKPSTSTPIPSAAPPADQPAADVPQHAVIGAEPQVAVEATHPANEASAAPSEAAPQASDASHAEGTEAQADKADLADEVAGPIQDVDTEPDHLYRVIARRFIARATAASPDVAPEPPAPDAAAPVGEADFAATSSAEPTSTPSGQPALAEVEATAAATEAAPGAAAENSSQASEAPAALPPPALNETSAPPLEGTPGEAEALSAGDGPISGPDAESVERVSRYNFDELSRILNDRIGNGDPEHGRAAALAGRSAAVGIPSTAPTGALVTLGGETLVLNRLPLGILVFRDQNILFANRAITSMTGYESVEALRGAGLAAIFPAGGEAQEAGPVNHLVQRDGALVPVTARLQSVSWQGKPALMLSASATEVRTGHEAAVKAFAEHLAGARSDGFVETSRAGVISYVSGEARLLLKRQEEQLLGRPISVLTAPAELPSLKEFLERPARFAETARPAITVKGVDPDIEIMLFAMGQAGMITGYFGFVRRSGGSGLPTIGTPAGDADPALLARLSRGVRRPLNTVIGFSDLIASAAFGAVDNQRYLEYARDIKTAGMEIAALVDELDDFARLRDGRYAVRLTEIDLSVLLDSIIARVRGQANAARVLVRSAVSERLPRVRADRASLAQAILNLLASAIDQTPQDGSVVLSAQPDENGGVSINVRDSAHDIVDLGERFVVFRDGVGRDGETLAPIRSSVGLALTRALLAVNEASLNVDPAGNVGTLFSLNIPPANVLLAPPKPKETPEQG